MADIAIEYGIAVLRINMRMLSLSKTERPGDIPDIFDRAYR